MDILERVVDKTSIIKSSSLRDLLFGDLDDVVKKKIKAEKKQEKRDKEEELNLNATSISLTKSVHGD